jgi:hypothetical protein
LTVRKTIALLGVAALTLAGTAWAGEKDQSRESMVARAMAVAEIDFELHLAQLGLAGSSLLSERRESSDEARATDAVWAEAEPGTTLEAPALPGAVSNSGN